MNWIKVEDQMPKSGERVIFAWRNERDFSLISIGFYAGKWEIEADYDEWYGEVDDNTETEMYYVPEGWYEKLANEEQCAPAYRVTHWAPIPLHPRLDLL